MLVSTQMKCSWNFKTLCVGDCPYIGLFYKLSFFRGYVLYLLINFETTGLNSSLERALLFVTDKRLIFVPCCRENMGDLDKSLKAGVEE